MAHGAFGVRLPFFSPHPSSSSSSSTATSSSSTLLPSISPRPRVLLFLNCLSSSSLVHSSSASSSSSSSSYRVVTRVSTATVEQAPAPDFNAWEEIVRLEALRSRIQATKSLREKLRVLDADPRVNEFFGDRRTGISRVLSRLSSSEVFLLKCLVAAGQGHVLGLETDVNGGETRANGSALKNAFYVLAEMIENWGSDGNGIGSGGVGVATLKGLLKTLGEIDQFYDCIGGIIGLGSSCTSSYMGNSA